ncbi:MAG: hypothetical protein F7C34_04360 [Desulfurococcales archaeon]|nr:hypothetical protein [Desulfurococcales archaeon]
MPQCRKAYVEAGSRIHLGFHSLPGARREWAGIGVYVDYSLTTVRAMPSETTRVTPESLQPLVEKALLANGLSGVSIEVLSHAPRHEGLGSTTQLVMASLAGAYTVTHGRPPSMHWLHQAARRAGRGRYGWVGTLLFTHGGLLACTGEPRVLYHAGLPEDWRVVLVRPRLPRGLSEDAEPRIMESLPPAGERLLARVQRGLYHMLLGVSRGDVDLFSWGVLAVQNATGEYFSRAQGGVYRADLRAIVDEAYRDGIVLGQSSWGPTLYAFTTVDRAESDAKTLRMIARLRGVEASVEVVRPRNMPAIIACEGGETYNLGVG